MRTQKQTEAGAFGQHLKLRPQFTSPSTCWQDVRACAPCALALQEHAAGASSCAGVTGEQAAGLEALLLLELLQQRQQWRCRYHSPRCPFCCHQHLIQHEQAKTLDPNSKPKA